MGKPGADHDGSRHSNSTDAGTEAAKPIQRLSELQVSSNNEPANSMDQARIMRVRARTP